jgi:ATP-dependent Clp protease ATP-binding subunit ClpC
MFERYTERARRALFFARYEAGHFGSGSIDADHLLLGLIREVKGLSHRLFERHEVSADALRQRVAQRGTRGPVVQMHVEIPFSQDVARALEFAAEEADRLAHSYIGTEHLLLGLLRAEGSQAAAFLVEHGMQLQQVREAIVALLREGEAPEPAP